MGRKEKGGGQVEKREGGVHEGGWAREREVGGQERERWVGERERGGWVRERWVSGKERWVAREVVGHGDEAWDKGEVGGGVGKRQEVGGWIG